MIEKQFYVRVPEARRILEPVSKHIAGYANAEVLTSTQYDVVQKLTNNLMGEITEASETVRKTLDDLVIGRLKPDIFRQRGLEQVAGMEATGTGVMKTGKIWQKPCAEMALQRSQTGQDVIGVYTLMAAWLPVQRPARPKY